MNAILQYLDSIASALEGMASGKTTAKSSATAKSASATSASSSIAASGVIEAPGVAEALDSALFTTVMQDEEEQRVSAVKKLFDDIKAELVSALFQESNGVYTSYLAQIHTQLTHFNIASTLAGLTDTNINGLQDGELLQYNANDQAGGHTGNWINIDPADLKWTIMGSSNIGDSSHAIYWKGSGNDRGWKTIAIGGAAAKQVITEGSKWWFDNYSSYLPTAGAVAGYVNDQNILMNYVGRGLVDASSASTADSNISTGDTGCVTARAVAYKLTYYLRGTATSDPEDIRDATSASTKIPTIWAVKDFVALYGSKYPTTFAWTNGTTSGPTGSLNLNDSSAVSFAAIPSASAQYSGIVTADTTNAQHFAGQKIFDANLSTGGTFTAASNITSTAGNITSTAGNVVATAGHILATAGRIDGRMLVVPTDAPSSYETGKWYVHINPNAISGSSPS